MLNTSKTEGGAKSEKLHLIRKDNEAIRLLFEIDVT